MTIRRSDRDGQCGVADKSMSTGLMRRRFLTATTCIATALAVPDAVGASVIQSAGLTASDFRRVLNTPFRATALSHRSLRVAWLMLTEVSASRHPHPCLDTPHAKEMVFSLRFDASENGHSQDTYLLSHPDLGDFAALLVPSANGESLFAEFHRL